MKRYSFRLANVLRLRRAEERRDREQLLATNARLRDAIESRDRTVDYYESLPVTIGSTTIETFRAEQFVMDMAAQSLATAQRRVTKDAASAALAQIAWVASSRKVAIIERLEERRRAEHIALEQKSDNDLADDLVTARFVLGQLADQFEDMS